MSKPILCLDFDGVCHSYTSGWINAWTIPDPPVAGLFPFLEQALVTFRVAIYSSRSEFQRGRDAMRDWFLKHAETDEAVTVAEQLEFPVSKPSAFVTLDDRAVTFKGNWPSIEDLHGFKPWNDHLKKPRVSDVAASTYGRE
jgi:hypothetical protein